MILLCDLRSRVAQHLYVPGHVRGGIFLSNSTMRLHRVPQRNFTRTTYCGTLLGRAQFYVVFPRYIQYLRSLDAICDAM